MFLAVAVKSFTFEVSAWLNAPACVPEVFFVIPLPALYNVLSLLSVLLIVKFGYVPDILVAREPVKATV